jgi:hypothetical protein
MSLRKCCNTQRGTTPHEATCSQTKKPHQKKRGTWHQGLDRETRKHVFESVVDDDMPDGAFLAMMDEFGLEGEDFI